MQPLLESNIEVAIWAILYVIWIASSFASTWMLVMNVIRHTPRRYCTPSIAFVLSLMSSQMLIAVYVLPANIAWLFSDAFHNSTFCKAYHCVSLLASVASAASLLCLVVVIRLEAMRRRISYCRTVGIVGAAWLMSLAYATRAYVFNDLIRSDRVVSCSVESRYEELDNAFSAIDVCIVILLPLCVLFWFYVFVAKTVGGRRHQVGATGAATDRSDVNRRGDMVELSGVSHGTTCRQTSHDGGQTMSSADSKNAGNLKSINRSDDPDEMNAAVEDGQSAGRGVKTVTSDSVNIVEDERMGDTVVTERSNIASDKLYVINTNDNTNALDPAYSRHAANKNGNLNIKLQMIIVMFTFFVFTTSAPYAWHVVWYFNDSDVVHTNRRHIDRAVYLFSYAYPWINALILLSYRSVFGVNSTLSRTT